MSLQAMLNRFRRETQVDGMRITRLLETDFATLDEELERFVFTAQMPEPDRARERRSEPRFNTRVPCDVKVMTPGSCRSSRGVVMDLSRSGVGLALPYRLETGLELMVRFGRLVIFGTVRHAEARGSGEFHIGVALRDVFEVDDLAGDETRPDEAPPFQ